METAFSLGSNLNDRLRALALARDALSALPGGRLLAQSPVYETDPVGGDPRDASKPFLNAVVILDFQKETPQAVALRCREIEDRLGRRRIPGNRYAPRIIDIDMLYWGDMQCRTKALTLPHPECLNRRFVCAPLSDLRPDRILPGSRRTVGEVLRALPRTPAVRRLACTW